MTKIKSNKSTIQHKSSRKDHRQEGGAIVRQETKEKERDRVMILTVTVAVDFDSFISTLNRLYYFSKSLNLYIAH